MRSFVILKRSSLLGLLQVKKPKRVEGFRGACDAFGKCLCGIQTGDIRIFRVLRGAGALVSCVSLT